jgi:hypothetical protein
MMNGTAAPPVDSHARGEDHASGIFNSLFTPDRSLFRLVGKTVVTAKAMSSGELAQDGAAECVIFPVFFPVSREFGLEKSSHETASTATQSRVQPGHMGYTTYWLHG